MAHSVSISCITCGQCTGGEAHTKFVIFLLDQKIYFIAALGFFNPTVITLILDFNKSFAASMIPFLSLWNGYNKLDIC